MNTTVFLYKGYMWYAWKWFGWPENTPGVGIARKKIEKALPDGRVFVKSRYDNMSILAKKAIEYGQDWTQNGVKLLIIPKSRFRNDKAQKEKGIGFREGDS